MMNLKKRLVLIAIVGHSIVYSQKKISMQSNFLDLFDRAQFGERIKYDNCFFRFDTIKCNMISDLDLFSLKQVSSSKKSRQCSYKLRKIGNGMQEVYLLKDSISGVIVRINIDSTVWIGRMFCFNRYTENVYLDFSNNLLIGFKEAVLLFTNIAPDEGQRIQVNHIDSVYDDIDRVMILDNSLNFKELLCFSNYSSGACLSIALKNRDEKKECFVNGFLVRSNLLSPLMNNPLNKVIKSFKDYLESDSYSQQFPLFSFRVKNYNKVHYRLNKSRVWIYNERFFLFE